MPWGLTDAHAIRCNNMSRKSDPKKFVVYIFSSLASRMACTTQKRTYVIVTMPTGSTWLMEHWKISDAALEPALAAGSSIDG
jgi:hypothetical protein